MLTYCKTLLRRFRREDEGSMLVEAVIILPTLFAAVLATFVFFDAYRNQAITIKANYTIADAVSRESGYITNTYMINTWTLHKLLTNSDNLTQLRVSVIEYDSDTDKHTVIWSRAKGGGLAYDDVAISVIGLSANDVPVLPDSEILIVVQTSVDYEPDFSIGLGAFTFANTTFTRPRWAGRNLCYSQNDTASGAICPGFSS